MRAAEFLLEDKVTHIADMLNDKIIKRYEEETGNTSAEYTATDIVNKLVPASKKYLQWVVNEYIRGAFKIEDVGQIRQELLKFEKFRAKIPHQYRDLNSMSLTDLYDVLDQVDTDAPASNKEADRQKKKNLIDTKQAIVLYKDATLVVLKPMTEEASCFFGKGTKWCTASAYGGDNYFEHYNEQGPLFIIMTKDMGKFQFHFQSNSFMDERDQPLSADALLGLVAKYPKIKTVLGKTAEHNSFFPLMDNPTDDETYTALQRKPWNLQYIAHPPLAYQKLVLHDGGLHNIKYIENPYPEIQRKALQMAKKSGRIEFVFNNINNPTEESKIFAFAHVPDTLRNYEDISTDILEKVLAISGTLHSEPRGAENVKPGQAYFDIVDDETGEIYTRWKDTNWRGE